MVLDRLEAILNRTSRTRAARSRSRAGSTRA